MSFPKVMIDLQKIRNNVKAVVKLCNKQDIHIAGVTKVFCGNPEIAKAYIDGGVKYLSDSRIENLIKLKELDIPKIMLRLPMISEVGKVVEYADISLNSEFATINRLSEAALDNNILHKIILMVDLGDLREGYFTDESIFDAIEKIIKLKGVKIIGLGTNLSCYGGVIPTVDILDKLVKLGKKIENKFNLKLEIISGGNSSTIHLLKDNLLEGINNIRLGESLVIGTETAYGNLIKGGDNSAFKLQAEIIEVKTKPSLPIGKIGKDAFGNTPVIEDKGIRKRIIAAVGKQDIDFDGLFPLDPKIDILGGSSDHIILDGTDSHTDYKVGDIVEFNMNYVSILRAMTSDYIKKEFTK